MTQKKTLEERIEAVERHISDTNLTIALSVMAAICVGLGLILGWAIWG